jgi:GNAT superfamily N-acetyltransferase
MLAFSWTALSDRIGPVLRYVPQHREGTPIADLAGVVSGRAVSDAAKAAIDQLPGWLLATADPTLAGHLVRAGARPRRHATVMQCDLRNVAADIEIDPQFTSTPLPTTATSPQWTAIVPSWRAAFPVEHPDHFDGDDHTAIDFLMRLVDGSELGPMHRSTTLLTDQGGTPIAGIVVNVRTQSPPWGGPWVADIWRDPAIRGSGIGAMLMCHAQRLLTEDGHVSLGLAVTAGNPARHSYEARGFRTVLDSQTVLLPTAPEPEVRFPSGQASAKPSRR